MKKKTLYMETTGIDATRSAGEITRELVAAGASQIATDYHDGKIVGLRWSMNVGGRDVLFSMPARVEPVYKHLMSGRRDGWTNEVKARMREQAERVAWRQLLRWVQAQIAMIDSGMVQPAEVFLPYRVDASGVTLWERMLQGEFKQLAAVMMPGAGVASPLTDEQAYRHCGRQGTAYL